jgi:hypothetical protein
VPRHGFPGGGRRPASPSAVVAEGAAAFQASRSPTADLDADLDAASSRPGFARGFAFDLERQIPRENGDSSGLSTPSTPHQDGGEGTRGRGTEGQRDRGTEGSRAGGPKGVRLFAKPPPARSGVDNVVTARNLFHFLPVPSNKQFPSLTINITFN